MANQPAKGTVTAGIRLIAIVACSYVLMHYFFFGAPRFDLKTARGISEIAYSASTLFIVGVGIYAIVRARKAF